MKVRMDLNKVFWDLVKGGLWEDYALKEVRPLSGEDWKWIIGMAQKSSTMGIVADAIQKLPAECRPDNSIIQKLLVKKVSLMKMHQKHNLVIRHLMALLDRLGVKGVLLKGQSMALNYAVPESRNVGDIDVYVGAEVMDNLVDKLQELGYTCEEEINDTEKHVVFSFENIPVELHRDSLYIDPPKINSRYQKWWENTIFSSAQKSFINEKGHWIETEGENSQCVLLPEKTLNVFYTFSHLFHHYMSFQFQYKQFLDVARLLTVEKENIDIKLLGEKLEEMQMMRPWQIVGCYLHRNLGLGKEYIPFYNEGMEGSAKKFEAQIHERIFYGKDTRKNRPEGRIGSKIYSYYLDWWIASKTFSLFPALTFHELVGKTIRGIKALFNKNHRPQGTYEHYLSRTKDQQHK